MLMDDRRQQHEVVAAFAYVVGQADQSRQHARRRDDRQARVAAECIDAFQLHDKVQALVDQQRKRVGGVEADRRDQRRNLVAEIAAYPKLLLMRPLVAAHDAHALLVELGQDAVVEDRILALDLLVRDFADLGQGTFRRDAVGSDDFMIERDLALQARHADLEELVHVGGKDQQELQSFENRLAFVQRLVQHADIELQLRNFTMYIQAGIVEIGCDHCFDSGLRRHLLDGARKGGGRRAVDASIH